MSDLNDREFLALMNLMMVSDPFPTTHEDQSILKRLLLKESKARGYESWTVAYHEFEVSND